MKKALFLIAFLFQSTSFAYIYGETGDQELDSLAYRMQQQDIEDRLYAIESNQRSDEQQQWEKDLFDAVNNR
ncbi:hypothetical protein [Legionella tucsonensis]|uniref:Uncharacterized protein n=1 Tax=Legionella tucsonensis TaxID=40335 RepID=A0A0W0ZWV8_9GAMM|nr:hypothetical protein [Legionella tucsonensis]KTD73280.1 hypothetical protein Ltuc_1127 [Legionella tucsonensis]